MIEFPNFSSIENSTLVMTIILFFAIVYLFGEKSIMYIIVLIFSLLVTKTIANTTEQVQEDYNKKTLGIIKLLDKKITYYIDNIASKDSSYTRQQIALLKQKNRLKYIYKSTDLVYLLNDILQIHKYNYALFIKICRCCNNIMKLRKEADQFHRVNGVHHSALSDNIITCLRLRKQCLLHIHNYIYVLPDSDPLKEYVYRLTKNMDIILSNQITILKNQYNEYIDYVGITPSTVFFDKNHKLNRYFENFIPKKKE
jgi:hypothetical protein